MHISDAGQLLRGRKFIGWDFVLRAQGMAMDERRRNGSANGAEAGMLGEGD